jgi:hypothetical protein
MDSYRRPQNRDHFDTTLSLNLKMWWRGWLLWLLRIDIRYFVFHSWSFAIVTRCWKFHLIYVHWPPISVHPWRTLYVLSAPCVHRQLLGQTNFPDRLWNRDTNLRHDWVRPRVHAYSSEEVSLLRYSQSTICACSKALLFYHSLPRTRVVSR